MKTDADEGTSFSGCHLTMVRREGRRGARGTEGLGGVGEGGEGQEEEEPRGDGASGEGLQRGVDAGEGLRRGGQERGAEGGDGLGGGATTPPNNACSCLSPAESKVAECVVIDCGALLPRVFVAVPVLSCVGVHHERDMHSRAQCLKRSFDAMWR
mmetsp:Transcript_67714/g.141175  ORF Transcript_67714/g.141175 Transcript_67714/m.141175 type:complete len:155 (-) Transcript_67714:698-1162(-)